MPDIAGGYSRRIKINIHFGYTELVVTGSEEGYSLDDSYTSTFATVSSALFGAHDTSKLLFPTIRRSPNRTITWNTSVQTYFPLENALSLLGCFLLSKRDKDVKCLGVLTVPMPDIAGGYSRRIKINIHFGYTELFVTGSEEGTNRKGEQQYQAWGLLAPQDI
jgi:hypothetical protein